MGQTRSSLCCCPQTMTSHSTPSLASQDSLSLLTILKGPSAPLKLSPLFEFSQPFNTPPRIYSQHPHRPRISQVRTSLQLPSKSQQNLFTTKNTSKNLTKKIPVFTINLYQQLLINMINRPSLIARGGLKFIVMDAPSVENAIQYAEDLKSRGVIHLVRTCQGKYDDQIFESRGIRELYFTDGSAPPRSVISQWLQLVSATFFQKGKIKKASSETPSIAVHCLAGLGRAPVLVAIALIEAGLDQNNAVSLIRKSRQGALNFYQIQFLNQYRKIGSFNKSCCELL